MFWTLNCFTFNRGTAAGKRSLQGTAEFSQKKYLLGDKIASFQVPRKNRQEIETTLLEADSRWSLTL